VAHGPLPEGLFGHGEGKSSINSVVYNWNDERQAPELRSIEEAKRLLAEAGYPNGRDAEGNQLVLNYDLVTGGRLKTLRDWFNKQLGQIGVKVNTRGTDANRWLSKLEKGNFQFIYYGWYADYPDPENFLALLYGPNGKVLHHGENYTNYDSPEYNRLYKKIEVMPNSPERASLIHEMQEIVRHDAPWVFAWQPTSYSVYHDWLKNYKAKFIGDDALKYLDIDVEKRQQKTKAWNKPVVWPLLLTLLIILSAVIPVALRASARRKLGDTL
jgi:oligopeptide transport system substrate-binding protein